MVPSPPSMFRRRAELPTLWPRARPVKRGAIGAIGAIGAMRMEETREELRSAHGRTISPGPSAASAPPRSPRRLPGPPPRALERAGPFTLDTAARAKDCADFMERLAPA